VIDVTVTDGDVEPPLRRVEVAVGEPVRLRVTADVADEVHIHGIDMSADVAPGEPAVVTFSMPVPGVYDIELEEAGRPLVQLEVR
jgi:heme/copper-type cytochrome/quinol oxidase subunit 2